MNRTHEEAESLVTRLRAWANRLDSLYDYARAQDLCIAADYIESTIANPAPAEKSMADLYRDWAKTFRAETGSAPMLEEITIEAPESWTWIPTSELQALKDRISELEADARIKAANANPGEPVEFKGLNGEAIVARMVK